MRRMNASVSSIAVVVLALACAGALAALEVPFLSARVNDYADLLSPETEARLETRLAELEQATGAQVAVLTIPSLEGEVLEDFSIRVVEAWKLGREDVDDGVLFLVARDDRQMRLEVGYGLEGSLTDAQSRQIIANVTTPRFKNGDFDGGVAATIEAVDGVLRGRPDAVPPDPPGSGGEMPWLGQIFAFGIFFLVIGTFSLTALASSGGGSWFLYVFLMPFWGIFPTAIFGPAGLAALALWVVGFPILKLWMGKSGAGKRFRTRFPMVIPMGGSGWSSRGGGGFSGGGFSGGGGSFGGGGASGSW